MGGWVRDDPQEFQRRVIRRGGTWEGGPDWGVCTGGQEGPREVPREAPGVSQSQCVVGTFHAQ